MIYRTCIGCQVDPGTCPRRQEIRKGISGLKISSVMFKCNDRVPAFRRGQRVILELPIGGDWEGEIIAFKATVLKEKPLGRFLVAVDAGPSMWDDDCIAPECFENKSGIIKARIKHLRTLVEPDRRICDRCDVQVDFEEGCWIAVGGIPFDCLRQKDKGETP